MGDYSVCIHGDEQFLTVNADSASGAAIEFVRSQLVCDGEFRYAVVVQDENGRKQKYNVNGLVAKEGEDNIYEEYRAELVHEYDEGAK